MKIDLDNLVFIGLDEAQERNAKRLESSHEEEEKIIFYEDCDDACKI